MDGQGDRVGEHVGHDRRTGQVRCDGGSTHRRHAGEPLSEEVEESHYTMADSVCAGGTVERTRRTARPRTVGTACSSWSEGVPRDFSLEASKTAKTPEMMHLGCLLVLAWGETTNRTMADGREWYSCRTIRCGSGSWQDCTHWRGRTVEPAAGPWGTRCHRQYSFRRQPEVTQRGKGVTTQTCFLPRGRRARARVRQTWVFFMGVYSGEAYGRRVRALQGETSLQVFR